MTEHRHQWTAWARPLWLRDSLGHVYGGHAGIATLSGGGHPVTPGWTRTCVTCPAEERS